MSRKLISKKTRNELCEYFVGTTLREIDMEFDNVDISCDWDYSPNLSGQRRTRVHQYYHSIDWEKWSDVRKFVQLYENVLNGIELELEKPLSTNTISFDNSEWLGNSLEALKRWVEKDGFRYDNGKLTAIAGSTVDLDQLASIAAGFDIPELERQISRARDAVEKEPGLAMVLQKN